MSNPAPKTEPPTPASNNHVTIKAEDGQQPASRNEWTSERDLVSSLWKLQELESKIHQLRTLLPDRLLAPLAPIIKPRRDTTTGGSFDASSSSIPKSPTVLNEQLSRSARAGVAEVHEFRSLWHSAELASVWESVDARLRESNGVYPQPSGMWERDYDVLLKSLDDQEDRRQQEQRQPDEQEERTTTTTAEKKNNTKDGWKNILEAFEKRQLPGIRIQQSRNESLITALLPQAGMAFDLQEVIGSSSSSSSENGSTTITEWRVSETTRRRRQHQPQASGSSRLEAAICGCLNTRPRKWDLGYLLEMIYAYADIKQTPCKKCLRMTDGAAQLPVVRRPVVVDAPDGSKSTVWEAYHSNCV